MACLDPKKQCFFPAVTLSGALLHASFGVALELVYQQHRIPVLLLDSFVHYFSPTFSLLKISSFYFILILPSALYCCLAIVT